MAQALKQGFAMLLSILIGMVLLGGVEIVHAHLPQFILLYPFSWLPREWVHNTLLFFAGGIAMWVYLSLLHRINKK